MKKAPSQEANVLGAVLLAVAVHAVILTVVFFIDYGYLNFGKEKSNKDVDVEFLELTEELLAIQEQTQPDIQSLLDKYRNVTAKEGTEQTDEVRSYYMNKAAIDEQVKKDILDLEKKHLEEFDTGEGPKKYKSQVDKNSDSGKDKSKSSSQSDNNTESYSKSSSTYNFSRDHEYKRDPAYKCKLYGEIIVEIIVDRDGNVMSSRAIAGDMDKDCLKTESESFARRWKFAAKFDAPKQEKGTITFTFLPQ